MSEDLIALSNREGDGMIAPNEQPLVDWSKLDSLRARLCCTTGFVVPVVLAATTGSLLFGVNTSVLNTSVDYISSDFSWCDHTYDTGCDTARWYKAFTNAGVFAGATIGALACSRLMPMGLRRTLLLTCYIFLVGVVASIVANGFSSLLWARIIVGFGVGISSTATPTYISEMVPAKKRGMFGVFHQLLLCSGQTIGILLGVAFVLYPDAPEDESLEPTPEQLDFKLRTFDRVWWRVMLGMGMVPAIIAALLFIPVFKMETPTYYINREQDADATELLRRINGKDDVTEELNSLKQQVEESRLNKIPFMKALKKPGYKRALYVGIGVSVFQQITGINSFVASSSKMFGDAGVSGSGKVWAAIGLSLMNVFGAFVPLWLLDRVGRRSMLLVGSVGMAIAVAPAAVLFHVQSGNSGKASTELSALAIGGAYLFFLFFSFSAGPITWVYLFEIFPMDMKAAASSICVAFNWGSSIIMVFTSSFLESRASYSIFTVCSILYIFFVYFFVRETKGLMMGESPFVPKAASVEAADPQDDV